MKQIISAIVSISFLCLSAFANFTTADEAIAKLQTFNFQTNSLQTLEAQDDFFITLENAVKTASQNKNNKVLIAEILKAAAASLTHDPTQYAAEVVLPIYTENKKNFKEQLNKLPKPDALRLEAAIKSAQRAQKSGNG